MNDLFLILVLFFLALFTKTSAVHVRHLAKHGTKLLGFGYNNEKYGKWPPVQNVALNAIVTANGTCGTEGREEYCKLNDREGRIRRSQFRKNRCGICDVNSSDFSKSHPVDFLVDGTSRWWQSSSLLYGKQFEQITITLTFREVYHIVYIIVKAANAPRPGNWVLERSVDGVNYEPWQYYAVNDAECQKLFGVKATTGKPRYKTDTDVICTSYYSKLYPLENGEIHTSLINGKPGLNRTSHELLEFTKALSIRLRFLTIRATRESDSRWSGETFRKKTLFYAISEIIVGGQCACNGHAGKADLDLSSGICQCDCEDNTCGPKCDKCCQLFNQKPYGKYGTKCERCECNGHSDQCYHDPEVGGICLNCADFTTGVNCEQCAEGYYRLNGSCVPCGCSPMGSSSNRCDNLTGDCECYDGFNGPKCNQCALTELRFPNCKKCQCNPDGSVQKNINCDESCVCKENVVGKLCTECKDGYFGFEMINVTGKCMECYCKHFGRICHQDTNLGQIQNNEIVTLTSSAKWTIGDLNGQLEIKPTYDLDTNWLSISTWDINEFEDLYFWKAPYEYLGQHLTSYGTWFEFETNWVIMRGDSSGKPISGHDLMLKGANEELVVTKRTIYYGNSVKIRIQFVEDSFKFFKLNKSLSRSEFMEILKNLSQIFVRAKYHLDQIECNLESVRWEIGNNYQFLEQCQCPVGYGGRWCEDCSYGYRKRMKFNEYGRNWETECIKCDCNNHSRTCDQNGACLCEHNTIGEYCERCDYGYYGNPVIGQPNDCKRCGCPLLEIENNFSPNCQVDNSHDYVCTQCPVGYVGDHCEVCDYGYYGSPSVPGSKCVKCECAFNLDCDKETGQCLKCPRNTEGLKCDRCAENHYDQFMNLTCSPCDCDPKGSVGLKCDDVTGQCLCKDYYTGRTCGSCVTGYAGKEVGCKQCTCNRIGSQFADCDPMNGECRCRDNVVGDQCDRCAQYHYGFSLDGCKGCNCNASGSLSMACDLVSGKCECKDKVVGIKCDQCQRNYWNLRQGCIKCDCNELGTNHCDTETGACVCKVGVGGRTCDQCLPNFFNFSQNGCSACENCDKRPGHICDPDTGRCLCPKNSYGSTCQLCATNTWGLQKYDGCKQCNCSLPGSIRPQCDSGTGICECRKGYEGTTCDSCAFGYFGYPKCKPCLCNVAGSDEKSCDVENGICSCDNSGSCVCKVNVIGDKCETCSHDSFNNSKECVKCFCFGRSTNCTSAKYLWSQIRLNSSRELSLRYGNNHIDESQIEIISQTIPALNEQHTKSKHRFIPGYYGNVNIGLNYILTEPFYWQLPTDFLGDRLLSYGGHLSFTLKQIDGRDFEFSRDYPLVEIMGNGHQIIQYFEISPSHNLDYEMDYEVRLNENLWHFKDKQWDIISRETFLLILQKVQYVIIKASNAANFHKVLLKNVRLDAAKLFNDVYTSLSPRFDSGIELCECPLEYSASSCQNPNVGFYRWFDSDTKVNSTIVIKLVGEAKRCDCNGRSSICDIETGHCLNCSTNTSGPKCEYCAIGHYGSPDSGCHQCPCPDAENNFAETCYKNSNNEFNCKCLSGYEGEKCTKCSAGYYRVNNGPKCERCACNNLGSINPDTCDLHSGQCKCKEGIVGRQCDSCQLPKHYLDEGICKVCDNCTLLLFDKLESMSHNFEDFKNFLEDENSIQLTLPFQKLSEHKTIADVLRNSLNEWDTLYNIFQSIPNIRPLEEQHKHVMNKFNNIQQNGTKLRKNLNKFTKNSFRFRKLVRDLLDPKNLQTFDQIEREINTVMTKSETIIQELEQFVSNDDDGVEHIFNEAEIMKQKSEQFRDSIENRPEVQFVQKMYSIHDQLSDFDKDQAVILHNLNQTRLLLHRNGLLLKLLRSKLDESESFFEELALLQNGSYFAKTLETIEHVSNMSSKSGSLYELFLNDIDDLIGQLEIKEEVLDRINYDYKKSFVNEAFQHVEMLENKAENVKNAFSITNNTNMALNAENAYTNVVNYLQEALDDLTDLKNLYREKEMLFDPGNQLSLSEKSLEFFKESESVKNDTELVLQILNDARRQNDQLQIDMGLVIDTIWTIGSTDNDIVNNLTILKKGQAQHGNLIKLVQNYTKILDEVRSILKETNDLSNDINYKLKPKYVKIREFNDTVLSLADEKATEAQSNLRVSNDVLLRLEMTHAQKQNDFRKINESIAVDMSELRKRIKQAKQTASGIKISLQSSADGNCARSFRVVRNELSIINEISLLVTLSTEHENATFVFVTGADDRNDFLAVDLWKKKIRFLWNLGADTGIVTSDLELDTQNETDQNWYQIVAERVANVGKLKVTKKDENYDNLLLPKISSTSDQHIVFHTKPESRIYIGDIPSTYRKKNRQLQQVPNFAGCLHELKFENEIIGLWNFVSSTKHCNGRSQIGGSRESVDTNMYYFNGQGYSVKSRDQIRPYKSNQFSISLAFKTFDENSLLFLAIDSSSYNYVSIYLSNGHVVFKVIYDSETSLQLETKQKYNTGKRTKITAARVFDRRRQEHARFTVNDEELISVPITKFKKSAFPNLQNSNYYFGGISPNLIRHPHYDSEQGHLLGCLGEVLVDDIGYNLLDSNLAYGLTDFCHNQEPRTVGFYGNGYVKMEPRSLKKNSISFLFRTQQANAMLLKGFDSDRPNATKSAKLGSYMLILNKGYLVLKLYAGWGEVELKSKRDQYNDGYFHSVTIYKNSQLIELKIDDELHDTNTLPHHSQILIEKGHGFLYFGGLPNMSDENVNKITNVDFIEPLIGAIKDVIYDQEILTFDKALNFDHVEIGRLGPEFVLESEKKSSTYRSYDENVITVSEIALMNSKNVLNDKSIDSNDCGKSADFEPNAINFENDVLPINVTKKFWSHNYSLEFEIRTFQKSGLLMLVANSKMKTNMNTNTNRNVNVNANANMQKNYVLLMLQDAKLMIVMKVRRKKEISVSRYVNDGQWHTISVKNVKRRFSVSVDGTIALADKIPKRPIFHNAIFFGGKPKNENSLVKLVNIDVMDHYRGCIRNLRINQKVVDMAQIAPKVKKCLRNVESGAYFNGDTAFAVYSDNYVTQNGVIEFEFEFKVIRPNGILFSLIGTYDQLALSVEISNGSIVMSGNANYNQNIFRVEASFSKSLKICDNHWHKSTAIFGKDLLTIIVDGVTKSWLATNGSFMNQEIIGTVYIGGVSDSIANEMLQNRQYYHGCLRNLKIDKHNVDWTSMSQLNDINLDSCPNGLSASNDQLSIIP